MDIFRSMRVSPSMLASFQGGKLVVVRRIPPVTAAEPYSKNSSGAATLPGTPPWSGPSPVRA